MYVVAPFVSPPVGPGVVGYRFYGKRTVSSHPGGRATRETTFSRTPDPSFPRFPHLRTRTPDGWETRETPWETSPGEPRTGFEENPNWISSWLDDDEPSDGGCPTIQRSIPRRDFPPNRSDRTSWKDRFFSRFSVQIHLGVDRFRGKKGPRSVEECERTTRRSPPTHQVRLQWEGTKKPKREKRTSNAFRLTSSWNEIRHVGKETWKKETRRTRHVHERTESNVWNVPPVRFVARKETRGRNDDATIGK